MAHLKKFTQQHIVHNNKKSLSKFLEVYLLGSSWQNFHLIETFFCCWANFNYCKCANFEQKIQPSGYAVFK